MSRYWRAKIELARRGDRRAMHEVLDEWEGRMLRQDRRMELHRERHLANGLTSLGTPRKSTVGRPKKVVR